MSGNASEKVNSNTTTESPPPKQNIDETENTRDDENEKHKILSDLIQTPENRLGAEDDAEYTEITLDLRDPSPTRKPRRSFGRSTSSRIKRMSMELKKQHDEMEEFRYQQQQDTHMARAKKRKNKIMVERRKAREIYREALHNTRNTITLVAVLISTFTFTAGVNPPGGVHQGGPLIGTAVAAKRTAYRVFSICNNVALFTSLCIVLVLVSIIPFKRKALTRMLAVAHKVMWMAVSFMATAYVAAGVVIHQPPPMRWPRGMYWTTAFLVSICAGSLGSVFVGLGVLLIKHKVMKRQWKKDKNINRNRPRWTKKKITDEYYTSGEENDGDSSIISDMAISRELGYHSY